MIKKILTLILLLFVFALPIKANGVEYNLPYPGLLPDNPAYILKVARDYITLTLVRDPKQKAFYLIFLSDKRIAAARRLVDKKNDDLASKTVLKAEEFFTQAVDIAATNPDENLYARLVVSNAKHEEIIKKMGNSKAIETNLKLKDRVINFLMKSKA